MNEAVAVGFLGLGQMGGAIAERLLGGAWPLHVHDPNPAAVERFVARGALAHESPRALADAATLVFACLPGQAVSREVALGATGVVHGKAVRSYVEMSTIGKAALDQIAHGLAERGIATVDAPVTGGPPVARAGNLTIMVAGAPAACAAVRRMLEVMGRNVLDMGATPGMAQIMKVVNNLVMAANMIVACEGMAMGAKAGLDPAMMMRVIENGTSQSFAACSILRRALAGTFDYGAALSILKKDVTLGRSEARALGVEIPAIGAASSVWDDAYETGFGDEDFTAVMKLIEQKNGVTMRSGA